MTDLHAADAAARERALDVTRSFIVQAPAGSGKTELLTQRVLALLATVDRPESVLAITFTRKAAAEMRNRIQEALRRAAEPPSDDRPLLPRTRELARAVLAVDASRGWDLLSNPGRLRVQTIDSLNLGLARRLPVLSGLGAGLGVEEEADALYGLAAERLLAHLPGGDPRHAAAVALLLDHLDNSATKFTRLVAEMLARRESWLPELPGDVADPADEGELRARLEAARAALVRAHLASLRSAFPAEWLAEAALVAGQAAQRLAADGVDSPLVAWAGAETMPDGDLEAAPLWLGLASLLLTSAGEPRRSFNKNQGFPPGAASKALKSRAEAVARALDAEPVLVERLAAVARLPPPGYDDAEWRVLKALFLVLRLAAAELQVVFAERKSADYPQFAAAARAALGDEAAPTDTALALDARLRHVLVDEFQDTSEAQVRLLASLTHGWERGDGRTLFLVGDPMQSIYRFRDAEVGLFLDVRDRGLATLTLEPLTLSVNFRSTPAIVDWVNAAFVQVLPPRDDVVRGAVSYSPGVAARGADRGGGVQVHAFLRRSRVIEAQRVADLAARRLTEDAGARIAVLVQGRSHLLNIVAELGRRGIAFQATDIDPLGARPVVLDLLMLTRALSHLADRTSWLAVLRAPWCGLTLAELHAIAGDDRDRTLLEMLHEDARRARLEPEPRRRLETALAVLEQARLELRRFGLRDAVERAWLALGGPATATDLRELDEAQAYLDQLATLEGESGGPVDFAMLEEALQGLYAPSRPRPGTRVELLTIHKSKGLQFDTVIVPGLERRGRADDRRLLQWLKLADPGQEALVVAPLASVGGATNLLYAWLEDIEREKLVQERRRLLYVAATRAQRHLHLLGSCTLREDTDGHVKLAQPQAGTGLALLWPVVRPEFEARLAEVGAIEGEPTPEIVRDPPLRRFPAGWRVPPPPPGPRIESVASGRRAAEAQVEFDWVTETTRHVGTVVHRELQRLATGGGGPGPATDDARNRYATELAELGVPAERRAGAVDRVSEALRRTLDDPRGRWLLDGRHAASSCELALSGRSGGETISVVIDRTFIDANGVRWIVDYKTSAHEGAGLEQFIESEQARYGPQLERYARLVRHLGTEPIRVGLYFPLLSAWREWTPAP